MEQIQSLHSLSVHKVVFTVCGTEYFGYLQQLGQKEKKKNQFSLASLTYFPGGFS